MSPVVANILAALSVAPLAFIPLILVCFLACFLVCPGCAERREESRLELAALIGRELSAARRAQAEVNAWLLLLTLKRRT